MSEMYEQNSHACDFFLSIRGTINILRGPIPVWMLHSRGYRTFMRAISTLELVILSIWIGFLAFIQIPAVKREKKYETWSVRFVSKYRRMQRASKVRLFPQVRESCHKQPLCRISGLVLRPFQQKCYLRMVLCKCTNRSHYTGAQTTNSDPTCFLLLWLICWNY